MNPAARRHARQYALQAIYQWQITGTPASEIETDFIETQIRQKTDHDFFRELIRSVTSQQPALDEEIIPFLKIPLNELDPVELAILRIGTYELIARPDIPWRVVLNESLELAKTFGSVEGYKFVNGVLDRVAHKLRADEIRDAKN